MPLCTGISKLQIFVNQIEHNLTVKLEPQKLQIIQVYLSIRLLELERVWVAKLVPRPFLPEHLLIKRRRNFELKKLKTTPFLLNRDDRIFWQATEFVSEVSLL